MVDTSEVTKVLCAAVAAFDTAVWVYDFDRGSVRWANDSALKLWSADSLEELSARSMKDGMSSGVAQRLNQYLEDFKRDPGRSFRETWTIYPQGEPVVVDCTFRWAGLPDGNCSVIEAIQRRNLPLGVARSIDAMMHSEVMTALYSETGEELYANRALRDALGPGPLDFGAGFCDPDLRDRFMAALAGVGRHREAACIGTSKGARWYDIQANRCLDAASGLPAFQVSATDITEMRETREELRLARDRALSSDQAKSEFVANMSHEMRTPMNGILGLVELLSHGDLDEVQARYLELLRDSGRTLMTLIEDVLELSSTELGAVAIEARPFDLYDLCAYVVEGLAPPAADKNLSLTLRYAAPPGAHAVGDPRRLAQVMRNMIGNAIKYTDSGVVELAVSRRGDELLVEISDSGPGIPEPEREKIFERFYRHVEEGAPRREGVGLGLAICKEIVDKLGGEIGMSPRAPHGAVFWFTAPNVFDAAAARIA